PPRNIGLGVSSPSFITCQNLCVNISFTNALLSTSVSIPSNTWTTPPPAFNTSTLSSINACSVGSYSIAVKDSQNGCVTNTIITILDQTNKPVLAALPIFTLDCSATSSLSSTKITVALTSSLSSWSLLFTNYPQGTTFSNIQLTTPPNGMTVTPSGSSTATLLVDKPGDYRFVVKNLSTGCSDVGLFNVATGGLNADFSPSALTGFAPLSVNFNNLSSSSNTATGTSSITTNWSFGNGSVQTTTSTAIGTSATYNNPGTYTVTIVSKKGSCVDSAYKVIRVDIPSKLEIPNVFTPNGDGSNDIFFLKTSNLTEITALIFDRWGNKVYDLTSSTGNIAWDGLNPSGKECASGTYFYIIKATGKDGQTYEKKGNVSLYR
ncbi:MAG: gliding motility-associated C-terminal domain-containing protein, partial [Bacteroidota bacterium]|nr:gliding motility-associated C-terminal domain-containing protein [Bacteroidota bacterium]